MSFDCDLFVIGGGSGGVRAARVAAGHYGARVHLAEDSRVGGTCVFRGCVPKKLMLFAADYGRALGEAQSFGWQSGPAHFDWEVFQSRLAAELDRLEGAYTRTLQHAGVTLHRARARLIDPHQVELSDGKRISARYILIATGAQPWVPEAFRLPGVWTSDDLFTAKALPRSILIVGGGYIACEFAGILAGLGLNVTQIYRGPQILRGFDDDLRAHVAAAAPDLGVRLECETDLIALSPSPAGGFVATDSKGRTRHFDAVLMATGRRPNTKGLGLEELGLSLSETGAVPVDSYSQTAIPSIFAVGDVTDRLHLTPVAIREGHAFADTVFGGKPQKADHALVPTAVFTRPEIGTVGLTEAQARAEGSVRIFRTLFRPMRSQFAGSDQRALMKLVVCKTTDRVLGVHIAAPEAAEMIQLAAVAVKMGARKADFDATVAVHPTLAEELVTLRTPLPD